MNAVVLIATGLLLAIVVTNMIAGRLPRKLPMPGRLIAAGGRELHCIERPGDGLPVVMIHGMPGLALDFSRVLDQLPGVHAFAFDRPGYGWSSGGPLPLSEQVDVVHEALVAIGVTKAVFAGHSYGGVFALEMAIRHPESVAALVLAAPAAGGSRVGDKLLRQARTVKRLQRPVVRQLADLLFLRALRKLSAERGARYSYGPGPEHAAARHRAVAVLARHPSIAALVNDRLEFNAVGRRMREPIDSITAPAIIIHGEHDRTVPLRNGRRLHEALDDSELREVEGTHIMLDSHPGIVASAIKKFLSEPRAAAGGRGEEAR